MKILICIKQVPDTAEVKLDPKTNTLIREGVPSIINHDDKAGLEAALRLREQTGGTVSVVCMGPRYMSVRGIVDAYEKDITVWGFDDLKHDLNPEWIGLKGSPTNVFQSFGKQLRAPGSLRKGLSADEAVEAIMEKLIERHII